MKEKQIKFSNILFYCVLMTLIVSGQILLGVYVFSHIVIVQISSNHLASYFQLLMVVFLVLIVFVFALVLVNLVVYCKNKKNEKKSESMAFVDSLFEEKEKNKENFQKEGKKVLKNRNIMLFSLNIFMFFVVSMFVGMFAGNIIHIGIFIPVVLILAVVQILFSWQFLPKSVLTDMVEECIPLSPEEMPTIFEIAIRAMKSVGVEYSFAICVCNEQRVSIMRGGKNQTTILFVCKDFFKLFSDVELMALFMHLFARLKREKNSLEKKIENIALSTTKLSFLTTGVSISKIKNLHKKIAERSKYEDITFADEVIKNAGMQKDFVSAHAKIMMFGFYGEELPERSEFENEECSKNYYTRLVDDFFVAFEKKKTLWQEMCQNSFHPLNEEFSFKERLKRFGIESFDINFFGITEAFKDEVKIIFDKLDKMYYDDMSDDYFEHNRIEYLQKMAFIESVKKWNNPELSVAEKEDNESGGEEEKIELEDIPFLYHAVCKYDECLKWLDQVFEIYPFKSVALYLKGLILLSGYDDRGIDYIKSATEKNITDYPLAVSILAKYISNKGLKEEWKRFKIWLAEKREDIQFFEDKELLSGDFEPHDLSVETVEKLTKELKKLKIKGLVVLKSSTKKGNPFYIAYIHYAGKDDSAERGKSVADVEKTIDKFSENITLPYMHTSSETLPDKLLTKFRETKEAWFFDSPNFVLHVNPKERKNLYEKTKQEKKERTGEKNTRTRLEFQTEVFEERIEEIKKELVAKNFTVKKDGNMLLFSYSLLNWKSEKTFIYLQLNHDKGRVVIYAWVYSLAEKIWTERGLDDSGELIARNMLKSWVRHILLELEAPHHLAV